MKEDRGGPWDEIEFLRNVKRRVFDAVENMSKPTIAAVNGFSIAGGTEIMLACDLAIASEDAEIGDQHIRVGRACPGNTIQRLTRIVGIRKAKEIMLTGVRLSAKEAERIGLVNAVAPTGKLDSVVDEMVAKLIDKSPPAVKILKSMLNLQVQTDSASASELGILSGIANMYSEDFEEGTRAFIEKRTAEYKGK